MSKKSDEIVGVAGSGTIATGLAVAASAACDVRLWARSDASAQRARGAIERQAKKMEGADAKRIAVTTDQHELAEATIVVESIVEELGPKEELLATLNVLLPSETLVASTTSSLNVSALAKAVGRSDSFFALHVFNPVTRMKLVELCFPAEATDRARERAFALCEALGKLPVEVPDLSGFVVNRLLFPYLFDAVRFMEETAMSPEDIDVCMRLGAGHPMGPLALLDYVGLDVSDAIGEALFAESGDHAQKPPERIKMLVRQGKLGRKSGEGFLKY